MALSPGDRISLIRESATILDKQEWDVLDLTLNQFGLPTSDEYGAPQSKASYVVDMIRGARDAELTALHQYLVSTAGGARATGSGPWTGRKLRLFCSHLAVHKAAVGQVADALSRYGVEPFVAHDSIEPSKEWAQVIENSLADCDAMIVFLHEGFDSSRWCDQEVGWAIGRRRPVLPLNYGIHPYGFLGKYQDQPCLGLSASRVATAVVNWLITIPSLHGRLSAGLVDAFVRSGSWNFTREIVPMLEKLSSITDDDLSRMEVAAQANSEIRQCSVNATQSGPEWVAEFVSKRRGPSGPPPPPVPATWPY